MSLKHSAKNKVRSISPSMGGPSGRLNLQDRIVAEPAVLVGKPVVKGTRLAVEFVIDLLAKGWTSADILENYPQLTLEDVHACLAYAERILRAERVYPLRFDK